jgi:hypothetical protein
VHRLIALSASPNENEARNAAVLAVRLIRKHGLVLSIPASSVPGRATPRSKPRAGHVADTVDRIRSPLGGECIHCKSRYKAGAEVLWLASGGGIHPHCYDAWSGRRR